MRVERLSILCCCLLWKITLFASVASTAPRTDTTTPDRAASLTTEYLRNRLGEDSRLYNGREYIRNGTSAKGIPFFEWDSLQHGTLEYNGIFYADILLEYDLLQDQLVIRDRESNILISLVSRNTPRFSIGPCSFRYIGPGTRLPETGYYQELYSSGSVVLLARKRKTLVHPSSLEEQAHYAELNSYYVILEGNVSKVANRKDLLNVFGDKKDELRKFIRKNHLSFKNQFETSLVQATAYYEQIKF